MYDKQQFIKDWKAGMNTRDMGRKYGITSQGVSYRAMSTLKLKTRSKQLGAEKRAEVLKYISIYGVIPACKRFGISDRTAYKLARRSGTPTRKPRAPNKSEPKVDHVIRVLKEVPSGFVAPKRVW